MLCIGLDIGSTSIKGALLDLPKRQVSHVIQQAFPAPLSGLPASFIEVSPQAILQTAKSVLDALHADAPESMALLLSGQMGGTILVDSSGAPLSNYISWRDQRTLTRHSQADNYLLAMRQRWQSQTLAELGNELQPGSTTSLLFWLAEQNQLPDREFSFASVADFVLGRLCNVMPQMEATQAIGLLDLQCNRWHLTAMEQLGIRGLQFPRIATLREPIGFWSDGGRRVACHAALGDQACALYGVGLTGNELSINVSTGSQVSRRTGSFVPGNYQTRCYLDGDYLNTITHLPAGRSLNALLDMLRELSTAEGIQLAESWSYIAKRAAEADGGGLQANLCFFAGPLGSTGGIQGITTENLNLGNLFRAAFQNMADNYFHCAQRLIAPKDGLQLAISGGLTRSVPVLRQLIEERFGLTARESMVQEETMLGLLEVGRSIYLRN